MKAQFFIISSVIMIYVIVLTFQYLAGFSDIRLSSIEEHQELSYIQNIKDSFIQTLNASNYSNSGDMNNIVKDIDFTRNFFKQELLKKGIAFDSKFIFFSNGFESNDFSDWSSKYGTPLIVNYTSYDGANSLYSNDIEYVTKNLSGVSEVYVRTYVNFNTLPSNSGIYYFMNLSENNNQILDLGLENNSGAYKLIVYSPLSGIPWVSLAISINSGEWHYFELYWLENGTNSNLKVWYDGQLEIVNQVIVSEGKGKLINQYNFGGTNAVGTPDLYVDCIAVSSDYVGDKCYPDEQNYFDFSLKTNEMYTETEFPYQEKPQLSWLNKFVNNTIAGQPTLFSLNWVDTFGLSGYIFSFDNCTGSFTNDTSWVPMTGLSNWSSVIKTINSTIGCTIRWQVYANDTSGKWNTSDIFSFPTTWTPPLQIQFVSPTDNDGFATNRNWSYVNVSITDASSTSSFIDWNRSLIGYWSMDWYNSTGVYDNSTYNNFGTFNGGLGTSNITVGKYGKALSFDGGLYTNIFVPNADQLNPNNGITISAWVNITEKLEGAIIFKGTYTTWPFPATNTQYELMIDTDGSTFVGLQFGIDLSSGIVWQSDSDNVIPLNQWNYVVATYDQNDMKMYVNGLLVESSPQTGQMMATTGDLYIGSELGQMINPFNGAIDEVRIYNRALSPEEIKASYNSGLYNLYHNFTNLSNGTYQYYAYAIDTNGNANKTETRTLTIGSQVSQAPQYFQNSINNTVAGQPTLFSLNWIGNAGLNGYVFSTNNSGSWSNESWTDFENSTGNAIFFDSFESGNFNAWTTNTGPPTVSVISALPYHGIYHMNSSANGTTLAYASKIIPAQSRFNVRAYVRIVSGLPLGANTERFHVISTWNTTSGLGMIHYTIERSGGNDCFGLRIQTVSYLNCTYTASLNTWYLLELQYDGINNYSTAYLNGVVISNQSWSPGTTVNEVRVGTLPFSPGVSTSPVVYTDRVKIATSYIGSDLTWSNVTKTLNSTVGIPIGWCVYANDTSNNWNETSCVNPFSLTTQGVSTAPLYFQNSTNSTIAGQPTLFSLNWTDDTGLSGYIFSTNNNGTWVNESWTPFGIARVQGARNTSSKPTDNITLTYAPTNGNVLILTHSGFSIGYNPGISSILQSGVAWSKVVSSGGTTTGYTDQEIWIGIIGLGAQSNMTVSFTGMTNTYVSIDNVYEYSGVATSNYLDKTAVQGDSKGSPLTTNTTGTTTQANELWIGLVGGDKSGASETLSSPTNGFTLIDGQGVPFDVYTGASAFLENIVSTTGQASSNVTASPSSGFADGCIATFKAATTSAWSRVNKTLNSTVGTNVQWCVYANDTSNNWNSTSCINPFSLTTGIAPQYFQNSANNTAAGQPTLFSLNWTDDTGLSGYIFRTNNSGAWTNDTWTDFENQTGNSLFIDGYESGDFSKWTTFETGGGGLAIVENNNTYTGAYNAYFYNVAATGQADYYKSGLKPSAIMYHRSYYKFATLPASNNEYITISGIGSNNFQNSVFVDINKTGGNLYWRLRIWKSFVASIYTEASPSNPTTGVWYSVEVMRDVTNGIATLWVNGIMKVNVTQAQTGNSNMVYDGISDSTCAARQAVYVDNAVVSTSYIGLYSSWSNVTKTLNSAVGIPIGWCVYANDTSNYWNATSCSSPFSLITA